MTKEHFKGVIEELKEAEKKFIETVDSYQREVVEKRRQEKKSRSVRLQQIS